MKSNISFLARIAFCVVCGSFSLREIVLLAALNSATAQVIEDGTTNTTVTTDGKDITISDGDKAGSNLFHSFDNFSVPSDGSAFFDNNADIANIFSRVTGGNISNIDGLIKTNDASLFLINPAGILFGAGARLDLGGGSFYGSSADSILFEDGEFSATDLENPPLLTIKAPIGLSFRDEPKSITTAAGAELAVDSSQTLALIGGEIDLNGTSLNAGKITLGGLSTSGIVDINDNLSFTFSNNINKADVFINNGSSLGVFGTTEGLISINAENVNFTEASNAITGTGNDILIQADGNISIDNGSLVLALALSDLEGNAGDINIEAGGTISLDNESLIINQVEENAIGNAGEINLISDSLELTNKSLILSETAGTGNTGDINLNANTISFDASNILSQVKVGAFDGTETIAGRPGSITVTADTLTLKNNSLWQASTTARRDAGNISINVTGDINLDTDNLILSQVLAGGEGDAGDISITAGGSLNSINSLIISDSKDLGDGGNITIDVGDTITLEGIPVQAGFDNVVKFPSQIVTGLDEARTQGDRELISAAEGEAGSINISARQLIMKDLAFIINNTEDETIGDAGDININVDNLIIQDNAFISAFTENSFDGGFININAQTLDLIRGGKIITATDGEGNAGNINLNITESIAIDGSGTPSATAPGLFVDEPFIDSLQGQTGLFADATENASGDGGNITIGVGEIESIPDSDEFIFNPIQSTNNVNVTNQGLITAESLGTGSGGQIFIRAGDLTLANEGIISVSTDPSENIANSDTTPNKITLSIDDELTLSNNSTISAQAFKNADGGNIDINTKFAIAEPSTSGSGSDIIASAEDGMGGNIDIQTEQIFNLAEREATPNNVTNDIDVSSQFGVDGNVSITILDTDSIQGVTELPTGVIEAEQVAEQACSARQPVANNTNGFTIKGRGGVSPTPVDPLAIDVVLTQNSSNSPTNEAELNTQKNITPIDLGDRTIFPARGVIVKDNGDVILTTYPTANNVSRLPHTSSNCKTS